MSFNVDRATANGGFPLPPAGEATRLVSTRHDACGGVTRVSLPGTVPARAVRRVVCERCDAPYEAADVREARAALGLRMPSVPRPSVGLPAITLPSLSLPSPRMPSAGSAWRWASVAIAAIAVVVGLSVLQGDDSSAPPAASQGGPAAATADGPARVLDVTGAAKAAKASDGAEVVSESTFSLALPAEWDRVSAQGGATVAAVAPGGEADATLWVEHDPKLDFASFEARSLDQLEQLAGSARVVERVAGPTPEATSVRIAADAPEGAPAYEALLRAGSGDYWYYLATTVQPDAPAASTEAIEVLQGSLVPQGASR